MRRRPGSILLVCALAVALAGASAPVAGAEEGTHSPNVTHVLNHPHRVRSVSGALGGGGTDIEFADLKVARGGRLVKHPIALAGSYDNGLQLVDIADPTAPVTVGVYDCVVRQGDVQVFKRGARTYATYTHDDPYRANTTSTCYQEAQSLGLFGPEVNPAGTFIVDITNASAPKTVSFIPEVRGSHNQTVAPGGRYLYNSNSDLNRVPPTIEVFDIGDFANPRKVYTLQLGAGLNSHDVTFSEDGRRAYSAAVTHTLVLDTTNLAEPKIIGRIVDPAINIHHQSDPVTLTDSTTGLTRTFLVVTDELAGAAGNAVCPGGGLHVFDITGSLETAPVKVGFWNMPEVRFTGTDNLTCTSHVLRMYPAQKLMTIAWYNAGVRVVDISGLIGYSVGVDEAAGNLGPGMREVGFYYFPNSDTWSVKTNRIERKGSFYMYGNDLNRGLDVYRFEASAPASGNPGPWLSPAQAQARAEAMGITASSGEGPYCVYRGLEVA